MNKGYHSDMILPSKLKPAVIGLGYVGLPLAVEMAKKYYVTGFDLNEKRINQLKNNFDLTNEVSFEELQSSNSLRLTTDTDTLEECNIYIVTVPTPIDFTARCPDLGPLLAASKLVGTCLKHGDIVVY